MGVAYRCNPETDLAVVLWDGVITAEDAVGHFTAISADPVWAANRLFITDLTSVSVEHRPAYDDIAEIGERFLEHFAPRIERAKWAVVADHLFDDVMKLEAHLRLDVHRMLLFGNLPTACVWMNLDPGDVQRTVNDLRQQIRDAAE